MATQNSIGDVRGAFDAAGVTVADWAAAHGFRCQNVYAVLSGRAKGRRGEAHRIAQALGLKSMNRNALARKLAAGASIAGGEPMT